MTEMMRGVGLCLLILGIAGLLMRKGWVGRICMGLGVLCGLELFLIGMGRGLLGVGSTFLAMIAFFSLDLVGFSLLLKGRRQ